MQLLVDLAFIAASVLLPFLLFAAIVLPAWAILHCLRRTLSRRAFLGLVAALVLLPPLLLALAWHQRARSVYLGVVPWQLEVTRIEYRAEDRWGIPLLALPGDNETGIRVYALPDAATAELERHGLAWLQQLPDMALEPGDRRVHGRHHDWRETPLDERARRHLVTGCGPVGENAFCVDVDPAIHAQVRRVVNAPGSYYAIGRSGVIVVSPRHRRVFYMYNG